MHWLKPALISAVVLVSSVLSLRVPQPNNNQATSTQNEQEELHPLTIEAARARQYEGSEITFEQQLSDRGGYSEQIVSYRSDGLKIYALLSTPDQPRPASGFPVVILDHGYIPPTEYRTDREDYREFISALARAGYVVIKPDYRGHGKSEGTPEGAYYSPAYTTDNLNLVASLKQFSLVDPKRIGQIGHSLGGMVALRTIVISPDIKATVSAAGVVGSANDLINNWPRTPSRTAVFPTGTQRARVQTLLNQYGTPQTNPEFWDKVSAINYVDAVTGAVQIHHGSADDTVPTLFSVHLHEALKKAGKPVEYHLYEGGDHQFINHRALFLQRLVGFFNQYL